MLLLLLWRQQSSLMLLSMQLWLPLSSQSRVEWRCKRNSMIGLRQRRSKLHGLAHAREFEAAEGFMQGSELSIHCSDAARGVQIDTADATHSGDRGRGTRSSSGGVSESQRPRIDGYESSGGGVGC